MIKNLVQSIFICCFFTIICINSFAQNTKPAYLNHNFIKTNLTSILLKNYSLQYERTVSRKISVAVAYRIMPSSGVPFKSTVLNIVGNNDANTRQTIEDFKLSNSAITPEIRFYLSKKGYGRGFYIAPFYRYATFKSSDIDFFYTDTSGSQSTIKLTGKLTSNTGGILFGIQHTYGKHIVLDIWLLGPHIGSGKGTFTGLSPRPLTPMEQDEVRNQLNNIDIPLTNKTVTVNATSATLQLDGPWGGIRSGISVGIKF